MQTKARKAAEHDAVARVIAVRGGVLLPSATDPPDCYIRDVPGGTLYPVEVTRGDDVPYGDEPNPRGGSSMARAEAKGDRMVRQHTANGASAIISGVHNATTPYAAPMPPGLRLPLPVGPLDPLPAVIAAIRHKCTTRYPKGTILVVDYQNGWPLSEIQLEAVGKFVAYARRGFGEVWIVPEMSRTAQHVPVIE